MVVVADDQARLMIMYGLSLIILKTIGYLLSLLAFAETDLTRMKALDFVTGIKK